MKWLDKRRRRKLVHTVIAIEHFNQRYGEPNVLSDLLIPDRDRLARKLKLSEEQLEGVQAVESGDDWEDAISRGFRIL